MTKFNRVIARETSATPYPFCYTAHVGCQDTSLSRYYFSVYYVKADSFAPQGRDYCSVPLPADTLREMLKTFPYEVKDIHLAHVS